MSNYTKFDLGTIKKKLANGEYESRTGAMRAIGKTQSLSEAEKDKARTMVNKYFGEDAAPAKAAKKTAKKAKKAAKKVAKKEAKVAKKAKVTKAPRQAKTAKKAGRKRKEAPVEAAAEESAPAPEAEQAPAKRRGRKPAPAKYVQDGSEPKTAQSAPTDPVGTALPRQAFGHNPVLVEATAVIGTVGQMLSSMELAKKIFPKAELEANVQRAAGVLSRAVEAIDQSVVRPMLGQESEAAVGKKPPRKGTRPKAEKPAAAAPAEAPAPVDEVEEDNTEPPEDDEEHGESNGLSEEAQLDLARQTHPDALRRASGSPS